MKRTVPKMHFIVNKFNTFMQITDLGMKSTFSGLLSGFLRAFGLES